MKKIILIVVSVAAVLLVAAGLITDYADGGRVATGHEPKYCIKVVSDDGGKVTYWGLGYKVIRYVGVSPNEPYESNIGVKMGSWFMDYELPIDSLRNPEPKDKIESLDDFYNTELTKDNDIRRLGKKYGSFDAQKDGCFVIGATVHNEHLYSDFMTNYENREKAFIRVAQNTVEGDLILYDILYYKEAGKIYLVTDSTRDDYAADEDRTIRLRQFDNIAEYEYENRLYWVVYNGELNDETFESGGVFVLAPTTS